MKARVLDTSVAVAWYLPESFSSRAREWRDLLLAGKVRLLVPSLHYIEFANVIRTYVRRGELKNSLGQEIYDLHLEAPLEVIDSSREEILQIALEYESTSYDAVFINLALRQKTPILTGERTTTPWVTKLGDLAEVMR